MSFWRWTMLYYKVCIYNLFIYTGLIIISVILLVSRVKILFFCLLGKTFMWVNEFMTCFSLWSMLTASTVEICMFSEIKCNANLTTRVRVKLLSFSIVNRAVLSTSLFGLDAALPAVSWSISYWFSIWLLICASCAGPASFSRDYNLCATSVISFFVPPCWKSLIMQISLWSISCLSKHFVRVVCCFLWSADLRTSCWHYQPCCSTTVWALITEQDNENDHQSLPLHQSNVWRKLSHFTIIIAAVWRLYMDKYFCNYGHYRPCFILSVKNTNIFND